jgi:hypothetical protein
MLGLIASNSSINGLLKVEAVADEVREVVEFELEEDMEEEVVVVGSCCKGDRFVDTTLRREEGEEEGTLLKRSR